MLAGYISGCRQKPQFIPEKLSGRYKSTHPGYENQYFELDPGFITMGFADGLLKFYDVKTVERKMVKGRIQYTVLCVNEDEGEEFNFVFLTNPGNNGKIHFRNKPKVSWQRVENLKYITDGSGTLKRR